VAALHLAPFTEASGLVFLSGQMAFKADGVFVDEGIEAQTKQVLENIAVVLATAGLRAEDIVKSTVWLTQPADFYAFNDAYAEFFGAARPARTTVVSALVHPKALVEIEVVARRPA
jgi:2-iminobutanoate/2-iminopropanoate deaminase